MSRTAIASTALLLLSTSLSMASDDLAARAASVLQKNCTACHGAAMKMSGLDLRSSESIIKGGEHGPVIAPGNPDKSRLFLLASGAEQPAMPPGKKLAAADIETLKQWIAAGAKLDAATAPKEDPAVTLSKMEERPITAEERNRWAFRPVTRPTTPASGNPIDHFLQASWKANNLQPAPETDRRSLIRRAYLDVVGIPPTPAEIAAFLNDTAPDAYEKVVDRLLASPHYGERWGSHWLDLVRYSDSGGFEFDRDRNNAWRYRDWVIDSFNKDRPYDDFVKMQLAGDEIQPGSTEGLIATGYLRLGAEANMDNEQTRMDELDGILATTGGTMLGMTIGCARCHNHKFDPIPQKDYYRMLAVFYPANREDKPIVTPLEEVEYKQTLQAFNARLKPLTTELARLEAPFRKQIRERKIAEFPDYIRTALETPSDKRTEGQRLNALQVEKTLGVSRGEVETVLPEKEREQACQLREKITLLELLRPKIETAMTVVEKGATPPDSHFLHHGSIGQKGSIMKPGTLTVASTGEWNFPAPPAGAASSLRRQGFAEWITSPTNPLTPRVMANRLWQHHFGEGLVRTPSNFGITGEPPTHPELLDWLASELMRNSWRLKPLHRLMLVSRAYRMASDDITADQKIDPDNRLLWRMPRQRLEGEIIRDSILEVSGSLDRKSGGPGIYPYIDPALWASSSGRSWPGKPDGDPSTFRRSVYIFSKRTIPLPMLEVFDKPDTNLACARRNRSTIAPQALILMNSSFVLSQAKRFAERLELEAGRDTTKQIERAYEVALGRKPQSKEMAIARSFFEGNPDGLVDFCQTIFNLNEFAYVP